MIGIFSSVFIAQKEHVIATPLYKVLTGYCALLYYIGIVAL